MKPALIAINARRHYAAGVPCWNPTLGAYYVLSTVNGKPKFLIPTLSTWARLESRGKRKGATVHHIPAPRRMILASMGLAH